LPNQLSGPACLPVQSEEPLHRVIDPPARACTLRNLFRVFRFCPVPEKRPAMCARPRARQFGLTNEGPPVVLAILEDCSQSKPRGVELALMRSSPPRTETASRVGAPFCSSGRRARAESPRPQERGPPRSNGPTVLRCPASPSNAHTCARTSHTTEMDPCCSRPQSKTRRLDGREQRASQDDAKNFVRLFACGVPVRHRPASRQTRARKFPIPHSLTMLVQLSHCLSHRPYGLSFSVRGKPTT